MELTAAGEPLYGERDVADLDKIRAVGLPFWLAGSFGRPGQLAAATALGAAGIQVGTAFAFCEESGMDPALRRRVIAASQAGELEIFTDPLASPTGFPFKVVQLSGTASDQAAYAARERICDLGYLRHPYLKPDGTLGYRCPSEPIDHYLRKGGDEADTVGRKCVCNGLLGTIGLGQVKRDDGREIPFVTAGNDVVDIARFVPPGRDSYTAAEVIRTLLA
jgi:nitronate monooxygenase